MAFTEMFKNFFHVEGDYEEEYDDMDEAEEMEQEPERNRFSPFETTRSSYASSLSTFEPDSRENEYAGRRKQVKKSAPQPAVNEQAKIVDISTTAKLQVVLSKPKSYEEARGIADHLNDKRTVVLNLEGAGKDVSQRIIDVLNGVAYANGGHVKKVSSAIYIITPYNVEVSGDLVGELENNALFF